MANRKIVVPKYRIEHDTTSERLAYAYDANDVGNIAMDLEDGQFYLVTGSGAGASSLRNLSAQDQLEMLVSLYSLREIDASGDVANVAGIGGVLASDTTPIMRGDSHESAEISWATGNVDPVGFELPLPLDVSGNAQMDGTRPLYVILEVYSGTTDKASFTVETSFDGATQTSQTADDTATKSATRHRIIATVAATDIPDSPKVLTVALTPAAAHSTNAYQLTGVWVVGYRK